MVRIYLEAESAKVHEYVFVSTLMKHWGYDNSRFEIVPVRGKDNLHNVKVKFDETTLEGGRNIVIFDADFPSNGGGYENRRVELLEKLHELGVYADLFLFPNNHDDGDVEVLLDTLARKDKHKRFFECFHDYECCLGKDYNSPDLKGKLYTYMTSQKAFSKRKISEIKSGQWKFDDTDYWDIDRETLNPLKTFIRNAFEK